MFVVWVDTKKAGLLLVNLPLVYLVDLFTEELYKDLNYMFRLILLFSELNIIYYAYNLQTYGFRSLLNIQLIISLLYIT